MANQEQLQRLQSSIQEWNAWRAEHPDIHPDLRDADLPGANLRDANLRDADLSGANLIHSDFIRADLSHADLRDACLSYAHLRSSHLIGANLTNAVLNDTDFIGADLGDSCLTSANLIRIKLTRATLSNTDLSNTDLSHANLTGTTLTNANLTNANLTNADLSGAVLTNAVLTNTYLIDAILNETDLGGANFDYAQAGWTIFSNVDLRTVKGLETVKHEGPSTIGTDTLVLSEGGISEVFLRGAGVSNSFITFIRSLVGTPIEYYSCFISYSSKDQEFVERLYTDLQSKGVRCWFAPEDLKIGDKIRDRIDQSIRVHDKLLLVLSQHSVNSSWVEFEVEAAIAKEVSRNTLMLFPIRLDAAVKDSSSSWAAHIRRTRNIGNFSDWKQHDDYQKALNRLLRDLKPETPSVAE